MKTVSALTVSLLTIVCSTGLSQSLNLGLGGGPAYVEHSPGGLYTNEIARGGLGFGAAYSLGAKGILSFPESPFSLVGRVSYLSMSGGEYTDGTGIYNTGGGGKIETNLRVLSLGMGSEWKMLRGPFSPYVGAQLFVTASSRLSYKVTNTRGTNEYITWQGAKLGVGLDVGARMSLTSSLHLDISGNYSYYNPMETYQLSFPTLGVSAQVLFTLF